MTVSPMWFHLRLAAVVSACWFVLLVARPFAAATDFCSLLSPVALVALAAVHAVLGAVFWWGSNDPHSRLGTVYLGLVVFALRSAFGIYVVLYVLDGGAAMVMLVEMVLAIGLFSALTNALPAAVNG